jgi:hypothetical protein
MRRSAVITLVAVLATLAQFPLSAEISIGGSGGFTYTLDNQEARIAEGYTVNQSGVPLMGEIGWKFDPARDIPLFGDVSLTVGARAGHLAIETIKPPVDLKPSVTIAISTTPVYAFARLESDYLYLDAAAGAHFSDLDYTTNVPTDLSNDGVNFAYSVSLGARYTFFNMLTFRAGPALYYFRLDNFAGKAINLMAAGGIASVSIEF